MKIFNVDQCAVLPDSTGLPFALITVDCASLEIAL
jgi:hypothetical protein